MSAASRGSRARARNANAAAAKAAEANKSDQTDTPPTESMDVDLPDPSMQLLAEAAQNQARAPELDEIKDEEDDSRSSSLSDIDDRGGTEGSEQPENESVASEDEEPEEDDTEAETERLEPSPDKTRRRKKVLLNSVLGDNASSVAAQDELDPDQAEEELEEKAEDGTEQTEGAEESGGSTAEESDPEPAETRGKKRKRADDDETAKALKRVSLGLANHVAEQLKDPDDDDTPEPTAPDAALEEDDVSGDESQGEEQAEATATAAGTEEPAESNLEDADVDDTAHEADASTNARTEEEVKNKKAALEKLSDIEKDFALLRDKLFADRNAQLAEELATIQSDTPTHPEYLAMVEAIEQLRNERIEHAKTVYRYKLQALQKKATTTRAAAQSQYMQRIRELRDDFLERASAEWYQIQRERRNFDSDKEPALSHFGGERAQWIASQTAYNTEVSVLSGVAKYVGFPAAPEIKGATTIEVEDDLKKMGISRNPAPTPAAAPISQLGRPKPAAEEQFIAETAWANPQHQQSQYLTNVHRQISNNLRPGSPVNTPAAQKQTADPATNGSASTIPAFPSSSLAPTPMSADVHAAGVLASKSIPGVGALDTPSKPPERAEAKQMSGLAGASQDSSQTTQAIANENGANATVEAAGSKLTSSPPSQPAPALKESMSGQLEGQSSLPPGVQVGSG